MKFRTENFPTPMPKGQSARTRYIEYFQGERMVLCLTLHETPTLVTAQHAMGGVYCKGLERHAINALKRIADYAQEVGKDLASGKVMPPQRRPHF
jgi:hypothetical protein